MASTLDKKAASDKMTSNFKTGKNIIKNSKNSKSAKNA